MFRFGILTMSDAIFLILEFVLIIVFLIYFFIKDKENSIRINKLEQELERLNKKIYYLEKDYKCL